MHTLELSKPLALLLVGALALTSACEAQRASKSAAEPTPAPAEAPAESQPEVQSNSSSAANIEDRSARRQAAIDLLTDGNSASALPIYATDPAEKFDSRLDEKLIADTWRSERRSTRLPTVTVSSVKAGLDSDIIRRLVRAHSNDVRICYSLGLNKDPELAGDVTIGFRILKTGKVGSSQLSNSTLAETAVNDCLAEAPKRWIFHKPSGSGEVDVEVTFTLRPS